MATNVTKCIPLFQQALQRSWLAACLFSLALIGLQFHAGECLAEFEQTREQCEKCCAKRGLDEYGLEQCNLKCFRNRDHCMDKGAPAPDSAEEPGASPPQERRRPPAAERKPPPAREKLSFNWPDPLTLIEGKEWQAAAQILALNGFTTAHPNYRAALQALEGILVDFVRGNPSGGQIPRGPLEAVLIRYR